jgi:predicted alpha/beta hydrolase
VPDYLDRGTDRLALHAYPDPGGPVALLLPAMGVPARYYRAFAEHLHDQGLAVVVADLRGTGDSTPRPSRRSRYGYADLVDDVGAARDTLPQGRTTILVGHSLGGQVALLYLARDAGVDGLALVATGLPYFRAYPRGMRARVLRLTQGVGALTALLRVWPGWGFGGRQARGVILDWGYTARHGRYPRLRGWDAEAALRSVRTPVLAITVEGDTYTPADTTDHLVAKLAAAPVTREVWPGGDHFRWVRESGGIAGRIAAFAKDVTPLP